MLGVVLGSWLYQDWRSRPAEEALAEKRRREAEEIALKDIEWDERCRWHGWGPYSDWEVKGLLVREKAVLTDAPWAPDDDDFDVPEDWPADAYSCVCCGSKEGLGYIMGAPGEPPKWAMCSTCAVREVSEHHLTGPPRDHRQTVPASTKKMTLLLNIVAQVRTWFSRPQAVQPVALSTPSPSTQIDPPMPERKRPVRDPKLWAAKSTDAGGRKMYCGPVVVAAIIGVDPAAACDVIQRYRKNGRPVNRTHPHELQLAFRYFGFDMTLVAGLRSRPPTLATWERERADKEAAYVVIVTGVGWPFAAGGFAIPSPRVCR